MGNWNRAKRRKLSQYGLGEQMMQEEFEKQFVRVREYDYQNAWVSMMLALIDRYPALGAPDILHSIGVDTLEYSGGIAPPDELADILQERTGFDIRERPEDSEHDYIPKEERDGIAQ